MKRGSALLIVLGMVSFMVISAVAFSAYMRASRLPSSYLRRTSSSRHLVKAALAEAIDRLDVAIGNDPYPGFGNSGTAYKYPRVDTANERADQAKRNYWRSHCFIGSNNLVRADETVSTLTLEALAYLPPALVNEARYYSRHGVGARWQSLGFDSGRYAFSAVDVSDHFDVNRIAANVGRNSSDNGKVSLAYVFENDAHNEYSVNPSTWDAFMDNFVDTANACQNGGWLRPNAAKLPLVSLADLNLAIGHGNSAYGCPSSVISPFCRYVATGGSMDFVMSSSGAESDLLRNMAFVTDSYFPSSVGTSADDDYDLNDPESQPFSPSALSGTANSVMAALATTKGTTRLMESVCALGLCTLWDYLDEDSVPMSLAIPTTERVPMVCALQPSFQGAQLKATMTQGQVESDVPETDKTALQRQAKRTDTYSLNPEGFSSGLGSGAIRTLVTFPFRRDEAVNATFRVGGRVAVFLSDAALTYRTDTTTDVLHLGSLPGASDPATEGNNGVFYIPLREQSVTFTGIENAEKAVKQLDFTLDHAIAAANTWLGSTPMYRITREWTQTRTKDETTGQLGPWLPEEPDPANSALTTPTECKISPLKANGTVDTDYSIPNNFLGLVQSGGGKNVTFQFCVWLYVKDADGKCVDLVPACMQDDDALNARNNASFPDATSVGRAYPLMKFSGGSFNYKPTDLPLLTQPTDASVPTDAVMCADPRWNWAPEHWFKMNGACSPQNWLANCKVGVDGRDRDIFMATSDAGYLQSVYELAFLPRLTQGFGGKGTGGVMGDMTNPQTAAMTAFAANFEDTPNSGFAWRTYRPFALPDAARDDFESVGFTGEGTGFRVNPYAQSDAIILAALANTPYNWMVAATNTTSPNAISLSERKAENFNRNYCFNLLNNDAASKFEWANLKSIAGNIRAAVRARADGDWKAAFDSLDWKGDAMGAGDNFAGATLSGTTCELSDADKKFLYGFWKDSFAAKQQLFLVFVRAEPTMMGGGAIGQTPPQLGARAVALVWRDPAKTTEDVGGQPRPHRTRVLFYRQFD